MPEFSPSSHRVYCAGPLFNQAERDEMSALARVLTHAGYAVYLPHRDGMEFRLVHQVLMADGWSAAEAGGFLHEAIFALDIYQLVVACQSVAWNLNGRTPDEGAVSEAAIAWALGKPIVAYKEDVRSLIAGRDNPLLSGLVDFETVARLNDVPAALRAACESTDFDASRREFATDAGPSPPLLPAKLKRAVASGGELWRVLEERAAGADNVAIARVVTQLFGPRRPARVELPSAVLS